MMTDELPPFEYVKQAIHRTYHHGSEGSVKSAANEALKQPLVYRELIAHARTLQQLAKYERPPVDEAELKRRQDAREFGALAYERMGQEAKAAKVRSGEYDVTFVHGVYAIYEYACHRDNVTPVPVEEWWK